MRIVDCEAQVSAQAIAEVEGRLGIELPEEYRRFLLVHNGGRPKPAVFQFKHERGGYSDSCVDWFLAIYDGEHDNFETYFQCYKVEQVRLPAELIPVAHDPGGNLLCIATTRPTKRIGLFLGPRNGSGRRRNSHLCQRASSS